MPQTSQVTPRCFSLAVGTEACCTRCPQRSCQLRLADRHREGPKSDSHIWAAGTETPAGRFFSSAITMASDFANCGRSPKFNARDTAKQFAQIRRQRSKNASARFLIVDDDRFQDSVQSIYRDPRQIEEILPQMRVIGSFVCFKSNDDRRGLVESGFNGALHLCHVEIASARIQIALTSRRRRRAILTRPVERKLIQ